MSRSSKTLSSLSKGLLAWLTRYFAWLILLAFVTLGGAAVLMLFKEWTLKALFTSFLAWPALGFAMLLAIPVAFFRVGRFYFYSALGGGLFFNVILLLS